MALTSRGFGGLILAACVAFFLVVALGSLGLNTVATYPDNVNVPIAAPVSEHAVERHVEAVEIESRCNNLEPTCTMVFYSSTLHQRLYLFWWPCTRLISGKIETTGGKNITAYDKPFSYWQNVVARDGYERIYSAGCN